MTVFKPFYPGTKFILLAHNEFLEIFYVGISLADLALQEANLTIGTMVVVWPVQGCFDIKQGVAD